MVCCTEIRTNDLLPLKMLGLNRLDLHGLRVRNAKTALSDRVAVIHDNEGKELFVIHGFNRGTGIRDYIRSEKFVKDLKQVFGDLCTMKVVPCGEGATKLRLAWGGPAE